MNMPVKQQAIKAVEPMPMLKTVEQMSRISGIGENKLRELMDKGEIEYIQNGNRRLLADSAIWEWYKRNKTTVAINHERRRSDVCR
jgi:excisionase family DNA binding protein